MALSYGIKPGEPIHIDDNADGLQIRRPTRLARLYIEPTNNVIWAAVLVFVTHGRTTGKMSEAVFGRIIQGLRDFSSKPTIFFGGLESRYSIPIS